MTAQTHHDTRRQRWTDYSSASDIPWDALYTLVYRCVYYDQSPVDPPHISIFLLLCDGGDGIQEEIKKGKDDMVTLIVVGEMREGISENRTD